MVAGWQPDVRHTVAYPSEKALGEPFMDVFLYLGEKGKVRAAQLGKGVVGPLHNSLSPTRASSSASARRASCAGTHAPTEGVRRGCVGGGCRHVPMRTTSSATARGTRAPAYLRACVLRGSERLRVPPAISPIDDSRRFAQIPHYARMPLNGQINGQT